MTIPPVVPHRIDPAGGCPHAANARLLDRGAVAPVLLPGDVEGMVVLGHDALKDFLAHPDVAKSARHFTALSEGRIPDGWPLMTFATVQGMTTADDEDHRRLRSLVSRAFTARRVEALRPRVEELTGELLDGLEAAVTEGEDIVELRRRFALPLPMSVICELLGVDEEFRAYCTICRARSWPPTSARARRWPPTVSWSPCSRRSPRPGRPGRATT